MCHFFSFLHNLSTTLFSTEVTLFQEGSGAWQLRARIWLLLFTILCCLLHSMESSAGVSPGLMPKQLRFASPHNKDDNMPRWNKTKPQQAEALSAALRSELRGMVALFAFNQVMREGEKTVAEQQDEVFKIFHGDESTNQISHSAMLTAGEDLFSDLFESDPDKPQERHVRPLFNRTNDKIVLGVHLTQDVMERAKFSSESLVSGRQLLRVAKQHLTNIRKAMPVMLKHLDKNTGEPLRSGHTVSDVADKILDEMHALSKQGSDGLIDIEDEEADDAAGAEDDTGKTDKPADPSVTANADKPVSRPPFWMFAGFMSLMFFGPFKENKLKDRVLDIFLVKDPPPHQKKDFSRSAARRRAAAREDVTRNTDSFRGQTKQHLLEERKVRATEMKINGELQALNSEFIMRCQDGLRKDLELIHKSMTAWSSILANNPDNNFALEECKQFKLQFQNKLQQLDKSMAENTGQISGQKRALALDLTADDGELGTPPAKAVSPK